MWHVAYCPNQSLAQSKSLLSPVTPFWAQKEQGAEPENSFFIFAGTDSGGEDGECSGGALDQYGIDKGLVKGELDLSEGRGKGKLKWYPQWRLLL